MLNSIHVENIALIDEADVQLSDRLNILTGETGAGKSIIIGSVGIALGEKASKDMIRTGADHALSELDFSNVDGRILDRLSEMGIPIPDDHVVISRRLTGGRSIARINGEMVSLGILKDVAGMLIDIHGQHEHQSLIHAQNHIKILDRFARDELAVPLGSFRACFKEYRRLNEQIGGALVDEGKRKSEISFLEYQISEIDAASLRSGEEEELDVLFRRMNNSKDIMEGIGLVHSLTGYDDRSSAGNAVGKALHELMNVRRLDEGMDGLIDQLSQVDSLLNDFNRELADYEDSLVFDAQTYAQVDTRLDLISSLKSKYGGSIDAILAFRDECQEKLDKLLGFEEWYAGARTEFAACAAQLEKYSDAVSQIRIKYADMLGESIRKALTELNFLDARFEICREQLDHFTAEGRDYIEFMISTNPGEDLKPLSKVASGGEFSRIMLAIKAVLADSDDIPTLIFDEIDTGISGRTAQKVSEKMAVISRSHQVICITHLPQIASMADTHFLIEKSTDGTRTNTQIRKLDNDESAGELARMLGGAQITDAVLMNAKEMKRLAAGVKAAAPAEAEMIL